MHLFLMFPQWVSWQTRTGEVEHFYILDKSIICQLRLWSSLQTHEKNTVNENTILWRFGSLYTCNLNFYYIMCFLSLVDSNYRNGPTLQEARFNAVYEVDESEPTTRSKMEINWVRLFPTVLPVQVSLKDVFPKIKWRKNKLTNKETKEKVLSYCFLGPFVESVEQMMNIKSIHEKIIISFERNKGSGKLSR